MNKIISFKSINDQENGSLSFFESNKDIPFDIKRIYYTYNVKTDVSRGKHAHKKLKQVIWCPYGEIEIILDNGKSKKSYLLDSPEKGLLLLDGSWRDIYWRKENSILCVAVSDYYDENDYIRDYDEFLKYVQRRDSENENQF